jgi:hypothetical protein
VPSRILDLGPVRGRALSSGRIAAPGDALDPAERLTQRRALPGWPAITPEDDLLLEFEQQTSEVRRDLHREVTRYFTEHFDAGRL